MRVQFPKLTTRTVVAAAAAIAALGLVPAQAAFAATTAQDREIPVPCNADALVATVGGAHGGSTLLLAKDCTYVLTEGLPLINRTMTLVGSLTTTIERSRAEGTPDFTIMRVTGKVEVRIVNISLKNGRADAQTGQAGGAIFNDGATMRVEGGLFSGNVATGAGGAIYNSGLLNVEGATFSDNRAGNGGAIENEGLNGVSRSLFTGNTAAREGGALEGDAPTVVNRSTFSHNKAASGGAIYVKSSTLTANDSLFTGNNAELGGAVYNENHLDLNADTFEDNGVGEKRPDRGGAIYNGDSLSMTGGTVSGNSATNGAGLYNASDATVQRVTFEANSAGAGGGGIYNNLDLTLINTRLNNNHAAGRGGGIDNENTAKIATSQIQLNSAGGSGEVGGGIYNGHSVTLMSSFVGHNDPDNCAPPGSVAGCTG